MIWIHRFIKSKFCTLKIYSRRSNCLLECFRYMGLTQGCMKEHLIFRIDGDTIDREECKIFV